VLSKSKEEVQFRSKKGCYKRLVKKKPEKGKRCVIPQTTEGEKGEDQPGETGVKTPKESGTTQQTQRKAWNE